MVKLDIKFGVHVFKVKVFLTLQKRDLVKRVKMVRHTCHFSLSHS
jgi:hypothetical protein